MAKDIEAGLKYQPQNLICLSRVGQSIDKSLQALIKVDSFWVIDSSKWRALHSYLLIIDSRPRIRLVQMLTWTRESHSLIFARNLLPKPSPLLAPLTSPAISTYSTVVATMFCDLLISLRTCMCMGLSLKSSNTKLLIHKRQNNDDSSTKYHQVLPDKHLFEFQVNETGFFHTWVMTDSRVQAYLVPLVLG